MDLSLPLIPKGDPTFPRMPERSDLDSLRARGLSPPPKSLKRWLAHAVWVRSPHAHCNIAALCPLPSAFFTSFNPVNDSI